MFAPKKGGARQKRNLKFLIVDPEGLMSDMARQLQEEGCEVWMHITEKKWQDVASGIVRKVDGWKAHKDWADVILFSYAGLGHEQDELRKKGYKVVGGSSLEVLETDRNEGVKALRQMGIKPIPSREFSSFGEARRFIRQNPARYVFKPCGRMEDEKELTFVGKEHDGSDILCALEKFERMWKGKVNIFLQKFVEGIEVACVDKETEILTDRGWKLFKELDRTEKVATLNPETKEIEYQKPIRYMRRFDEKIYRYSNYHSLEFAVTRDHSMAILEHNDLYYKNQENIKLIPLKDIRFKAFIKKDGIWNGEKIDNFILPSIEKLSGWRGAETDDEKTIRMNDWLQFLGWYFSEGCVSKSGYTVLITQSFNNGDKRAIIENVLNSLPFNWNKNGNNFRITNKQLYEYLVQFGKKEYKKLPDFIKNLSSEKIKIFLDSFFLGDGSIHKGTKQYLTGLSKIMANQIQELLLKTGKYGVIKEMRTKPYFNKKFNRTINSKNICYSVIEYRQKYSSLFKKNVKEADYYDYTYCVEVPNHIIYVRRNGKPMWIGNCGCYFNGHEWIKPVHVNFEHKKLMPGEIGMNTGEQGTAFYFADNCPLFDMTLGKMTQILREKNHVGIIDLNMIINEAGIHPLEFCVRNGYPALQIETASLSIPWSEFYLKLAKGESTRFSVRAPYAVGVVVSVPPYPYENRELFRKLSEGQTILIKGKEKFVRYGDVKKKGGELVPAGNMGYLLICVGLGNTLKKAMEDAYDTVAKVDVKDMMYRNDIGKKVIDGKWIEKLKEWGYLR